MPYLGSDLEKLGEDKQEGDSKQLETIKVSTHIPSTSSEVEVQQPERDDICETVVEEYLDEGDSLRDYQLTRDRVRRPHREPQRFRYESEVAFAYASFEELVDREPRSYREAFKSEQSNEWLEAMKEEMSSLKKN
ncbi:Retrovirus-related Pol polyprotein from transposon TNT 1-94 [Abeliophyllum distichum]|uniref:Retrovirus-related Pol polyprotein from transposon TNT 1-94 n=1 Tax=Abeliophyllum distichum TaxID=126358 RepID=A0ABD1VVM4_9LAMI